MNFNQKEHKWYFIEVHSWDRQVSLQCCNGSDHR